MRWILFIAILAVLPGEAQTKIGVRKQPVKRSGYRPTAGPLDLYQPPFGQIQYPPQYGLLGGQQLPGAPQFIFGENNEVIGMLPANLPPYLRAMNCGIPGVCDGGPATKYNILKYGSMQGWRPGQPLVLQNPAAAQLNSPNGFANGFPGVPGMPNMPGGFPEARGGLDNPAGSSQNSGVSQYQAGPTLTGQGLLKGLCVQENQHTDQVKRGYCRTLTEIIEKDPCIANVLTQLQTLPAPRHMEKYCGNFDQLKRNPTTHVMFWTQLLAALAQEESGWNPTVTGDEGSSKGIFQIGEADEGRYGCSCRGLQVFDAHSNIKCGAWVAMSNMFRDRNMGEGEVRLRNDSARGIARYFGPFNDNQHLKRDRIAQKTKNWCSKANVNGEGATPAATIE